MSIEERSRGRREISQMRRNRKRKIKENKMIGRKMKGRRTTS